MKKNNRKKIWINKASSYKDAEKFEHDYYNSMNSIERISIMQDLRESYLKLKGKSDESRKGLRRVIKIIKQT